MRMKKFFTLFFLSLPIFLLAQAENSQINPEQIAKQYLETHLADWQLQRSDISDIALVNNVYTKHNQVTTLYYNQRSHGIELYNAIYNISILPSGKVLIANNRFYKDIANKISTSTASIQSDDALRIALKGFDLPKNALIPTIKERKDNYFRYNKGDIAQIDITSKLSYFPQGDQFHLAWDIMVEPINQSDLWSFKIDAITGKVLEKKSMTIHCSFDRESFKKQYSTCVDRNQSSTVTQNMAGADGASYRVFPYTIEGPIYGNRELLTDPADLNASPYGWHDTDGQDGAEYTITRGNNVHAYLDLDDSGTSAGDEPDGGASLVFDFPYDINNEASENSDAAVVNLFYMNNFMHDFTYRYGFDEDSGNFQEKKMQLYLEIFIFYPWSRNGGISLFHWPVTE